MARRRGGRNPDPVRVAAAGIGGCAERCAIDRRDTEDNALAEIARIVAGLPKETRQRALDEAAGRYVDSDQYRYGDCAALLQRAGADLDRARVLRAERQGGSFVVDEG